MEQTKAWIKALASKTSVLVTDVPNLDDNGNTLVSFEDLTLVLTESVSTECTCMIVSASPTMVRAVARCNANTCKNISAKEWICDTFATIDCQVDVANGVCWAEIQTISALKEKDMIISRAFASLRSHKVAIDGDDDDNENQFLFE